jgi:hypothetical protein
MKRHLSDQKAKQKYKPARINRCLIGKAVSITAHNLSVPTVSPISTSSLFTFKVFTFLRFDLCRVILVGRDSSVDIATRYGLDGPGIKSLWGEIFRKHPDRTGGIPCLFLGGKEAGT